MKALKILLYFLSLLIWVMLPNPQDHAEFVTTASCITSLFICVFYLIFWRVEAWSNKAGKELKHDQR